MSTKVTIQDIVANRKKLRDNIGWRMCELARHLKDYHGRVFAAQRTLGVDPYFTALKGVVGDAFPNVDWWAPDSVRLVDIDGKEGFQASWPGCDIVFYDIRPKAGGDVKLIYGDPELVDRHTRVARTVEINNRSYDPLPWTPRFATVKEDEDTEGKQLGTQISVGLSQSISYGSKAYGVEGTTNLSFNVSQSINLSEQKRKLFRTTFDSVTDVEVKPWTTQYVDEVVDEGRMRQHLTAVGDLDFSISFSSHDFYWCKWESIADAIQCMTGVGKQWFHDSGGKGTNFADLYRNSPMLELLRPLGDIYAEARDDFDIINRFFGPLNATLETDLEFEGAFRYKYDYRSKDLPIPEDAEDPSEG